MQQGKDRIVAEVDIEVKQKLKMICAIKGGSMTDHIVKFINETYEKEVLKSNK